MTPTPTYTAQAEKLAGSMREFVALLESTLQDVVTGPDGLPFIPPVNVNSAAYLAAEEANAVAFVALRDEAGNLVGAAASSVQRHLHNGILTAITDALHLTPKALDCGGGAVLYEAVEADLQSRGVVRWLVGERFDIPRPLPLVDLGFLPVGAYHGRWLG